MASCAQTLYALQVLLITIDYVTARYTLCFYALAAVKLLHASSALWGFTKHGLCHQQITAFIHHFIAPDLADVYEFYITVVSPVVRASVIIQMSLSIAFPFWVAAEQKGGQG